jgi:hypothetical protein
MIDLSWSHHQLLPFWGVGLDCDPFSWYYTASTDCAAILAISSAAENLNQIGSNFPNIKRYSFFLDLIPSSQIFPQHCPCTCRKQVRFLPGWSLSSLSPPMECSRWSAQSWWSLRRYPDGGDQTWDTRWQSKAGVIRIYVGGSRWNGYQDHVAIMLLLL